MCTAQCGSMEAKALSFVLCAAGSEHHMSSTRRVFTYVVGGRVGMNDTCYFTLDMKKLDLNSHLTLQPLQHLLPLLLFLGHLLPVVFYLRPSKPNPPLLSRTCSTSSTFEEQQKTPSCQGQQVLKKAYF